MGKKRQIIGLHPRKPIEKRPSQGPPKPSASAGPQRRPHTPGAGGSSSKGKGDKVRGGSGGNSHSSLTAFRRWLDDFEAVSSALERHGDLEELLNANAGLVRIKNFLPRAAAEGVLQVLQRLPDHAWKDTSAERDYTHNNISHAFESVKEGGDDLSKVFRVMSLLLPESLFTFSAAKYTSGDHIEAHDDRAYTNVRMEDGEVVECSRRIAAILYLTPGWKKEWGGHLIDMVTKEVHIPEFNSLVAFRIPRYHVVTPVTGDQPRYSIFGWFLEPGRLYDLHLKHDDEMEEEEEQQQQQQKQQHQKKKRLKQQQQQQQQQQQEKGREGAREEMEEQFEATGEGVGAAAKKSRRHKASPGHGMRLEQLAGKGGGTGALPLLKRSKAAKGNKRQHNEKGAHQRPEIV